MPTYSHLQYEIYLAEDRSDLPFSTTELAEQARALLSPQAYSYVASGASSKTRCERTPLRSDAGGLSQGCSEMLAQRDLSGELFGARFDAPVFVAPVGVQSIVHPDGELATATAAGERGVPLDPELGLVGPARRRRRGYGKTPRWFQLYWPKDPKLTASFLSRAEMAGYSAVVITLDNALVGWRTRDLALKYLPFLGGPMANYFSDRSFSGSSGSARKKISQPPFSTLPESSRTSH